MSNSVQADLSAVRESHEHTATLIKQNSREPFPARKRRGWLYIVFSNDCFASSGVAGADDDLAENRDRWRTQAEQAMRLLTDQRPAPHTQHPPKLVAATRAFYCIGKSRRAGASEYLPATS